MKRLKFWLATWLVAFCCVPSAWADDEVNYFDVIAKHELSDTEMTLTGEGWKVGLSSSSDADGIYQYVEVGSAIELDGTVTLTQPSVLYYKLGSVSNKSADADLYIDGEKVRSYSGQMMNENSKLKAGYSYLLPAGKHDIVWKFTHNGSYQNRLAINFYSVGVISAPLISVNLLESGSLGSEVLYQVDNVKDVRNLKIKGRMNSEDWSRLALMTNLYSLDLSEVENLTELSLGQISYSDKSYSGSISYTYYACRFPLCSLILPPNLQSIGKYALYGTMVEDLEIPASVTSIGGYAFSNSWIRNAHLAKVNVISEYAFQSCYLLQDIVLSDNLDKVERGAFDGDYSLKPKKIVFPSTLWTVGDKAFQGCKNLNFRFPDHWLALEREAFYGTAIDSLILKDNYSTINGNFSPFYNLPNLVYAEFSTQVSNLNLDYLFTNSPRLNTIVLKCPTVVGTSYEKDLANITLKVPSYLVNSYKLDGFWYNAKAIEGFSTADIDWWYLANPLTLNARDRFEGNPSLYLAAGGSLKVNGDAAMSLKNLTLSEQASNAVYSQLFSNCDNITLTGTFDVRYDTKALTWYFVSLPFDMAVSDITVDNGSAYAIRYYDGAARAANGTGGSWKNYETDAVVKAGTGFIIQTSKDDVVHFWAQDDASKQLVVANKEFVKALDANDSESAANKGWNLVGNPWECYFNNHSLNFTAPITIYNSSSKNYTAYSLIDDDYAIRPNQAFFVQCPDEVSSIGFPTNGRQLTSTIENQNGAKAREAQMQERYLMDIELSNGTLADKTRLVVNPKAAMDYETSLDASKFFAFDTDVPQIYSLDDEGTEYAINERPLSTGILPLAVLLPAEGTYTLSAPRNELGKVVLVDTETGVSTDLSEGAYTFEAAAGTVLARFYVDLNETVATGIEQVETSVRAAEAEVYYNLAGQRVAHPVKGLYIKGGKKVFVK